MNYITSTELRTKSNEFISDLLLGKEIELVHRSKKLGKIRLVKEENLKVFNGARFAKIVEKMNFPKLSLNQREERYRKAMMEKHA